MSEAGLLDHLAIGVAHWRDSYERFAGDLGGEWSHGGDAGEFAPYQLVYQHGMRLEFIAPGSQTGFMHRFIDRDGPGPHHITFRVPSLTGALDAVAALGIEPLGGRTDIPFWDEAFLHPKACGVGTLIQLAEINEQLLRDSTKHVPLPEGFPTHQEAQQSIAWTGLTANDLGIARALFVDLLDGTIREEASGWMLIDWGPGRSLLVRTVEATPGGAPLWDGAPTPGVAHIVVGPHDLSPGQLAADAGTARLLEHDPRTQLPVWVAAKAPNSSDLLSEVGIQF